MKRIVFAALFAAFSLAASAGDAISGRGVIKKVDPARLSINLSHEAIPALQWPAMTMDFRVKDAALLKGREPGQKIEFALEKSADGRYLLVSIAPAK